MMQTCKALFQERGQWGRGIKVTKQKCEKKCGEGYGHNLGLITKYKI
jgi:hypothetical protein